ncbi:MAG: hypothetical protein V8R80_10495 [Eubacterium sp.]
MKLLNGGCPDSIPVQAFRKLGFARNVVVLTQHDGYVKQPEYVKKAQGLPEVSCVCGVNCKSPCYV